jgi:hypothetical protein
MRMQDDSRRREVPESSHLISSGPLPIYPASVPGALTAKRDHDRFATAKITAAASQKRTNMNQMKKLIVLSLLLALAGGISGATARADDNAPTPQPETPAQPAETPTPEAPPPAPAPESPAPETPAPTDPTPAPPTPNTPVAPTPTPTAPETPATPEKAAPKATKPVEQQLNGRVVALDKAGKTITIQVNNQTYVLQVSESTRFVKAGKEKSADDLIIGEEVTVTVALRETPAGRVEIVVVAVDLPAGTEAQGGGSVAAAKVPPFVSLPNPANIGGQVRSPSN